MIRKVLIAPLALLFTMSMSCAVAGPSKANEDGAPAATEGEGEGEGDGGAAGSSGKAQSAGKGGAPSGGAGASGSPQAGAGGSGQAGMSQAGGASGQPGAAGMGGAQAQAGSTGQAGMSSQAGQTGAAGMSGGTAQGGAAGQAGQSAQGGAGAGGSAQAGQSQAGSAQGGSAQGGAGQAGQSAQAGQGGSSQGGSSQGGSSQGGSSQGGAAQAGSSQGGAGQAGAPAVEGDTCPGIALSVGATEVVVDGDNGGAAVNDYHPSCNASDARDLVYAITAEIDGTLLVTVDGASGVDPIVFARKTDCASGPEIGCSDGALTSAVESLSVPVTAGTVTWVFVDSYKGGAGAFTMKARVEKTPDGAACPGAVVNVTAGQTATFSSDTTYAGADLTGDPCSAADAPEVVAQVIPDVAGTLTVTVDPAAGFDAKVYARATCEAGPDLKCFDGGGSGTAETFSIDVEAATPLFVVIDGAVGSKGAFTASFDLVPRPANDTCATAQHVDADPAAPVIVQGTTSGALHDTTPKGCGGTAKSRDVFYEIVSPKNGELTVKLTAPFDPVLYAYRPTCGASTSVIACEDTSGNSETTTIAVKAGEPVYVAVDAYASNQAGDFTLEVSLVAAPDNDTCATADVVDLAAGSMVVSGTTTAAAHDYTPSCATLGQGEDVVYQIKPAVAGKLTARLTGSYDTVLYGYKGACGSGTSIGCDDQTPSSTETISASVDPAESYFIVVDGYNGANGSFDLTLELLQAPANDSCAAPTAVSLATGETKTLDGDTTAAADDHFSTCPASGTAGDVVYLVTPQANGKLTISVDATTNSLDPVLYAGTGACVTGAQIACKDGSGSGGVESIVVQSATAGTTYWVVADSYKGTAGPFKISFTLQ